MIVIELLFFAALCPRIFNVLGEPDSADQPVSSWIRQIRTLRGQGPP